MRSSNPIFRSSVMDQAYAVNDRPMTVSGTMNKLFILSIIMMIAAAIVHHAFAQQHMDAVMIASIAGPLIGFVLAMIISFNPHTAKMLSPFYALMQGAGLAAISCFYEAQYQGIVFQAIFLTFLVVFVMAILYKIGAIKATEKFRSVITAAGLAIMVFYIISIILYFCHINVAYFTSNSPLAIGINVVIALVAALYLILDFDFIERGANAPLPSSFEWYGAFGLLVTIVWLYIELLRLLARSRNR